MSECSHARHPSNKLKYEKDPLVTFFIKFINSNKTIAIYYCKACTLLAVVTLPVKLFE